MSSFTYILIEIASIGQAIAGSQLSEPPNQASQQHRSEGDVNNSPRPKDLGISSGVITKSATHTATKRHSLHLNEQQPGTGGKSVRKEASTQPQQNKLTRSYFPIGIEYRHKRFQDLQPYQAVKPSLAHEHNLEYKNIVSNAHNNNNNPAITILTF